MKCRKMGWKNQGCQIQKQKKGSEQTKLAELSEVAKNVTEIIEQTEEKTVLQQEKGEVVE